MRKLFAAILLVGFWAGLAGPAAEASQRAKTNDLHLVQKIYIEDLGSSDEAARFRLLLEDELFRRGFTAVDKPEKADAVLSGALSVSHPAGYGGGSDVAVTVRLISQGGERLWSINLPRPVSFPAAAFKMRGLKFKEPVERRAEELAKELREDWEKSARAAGLRPKK